MRYIREVRNIKIGEAAKEMGIPRTYLSSICNGRIIPGKKTAQKIEEWSNGWIKAKDIIFPTES